MGVGVLQTIFVAGSLRIKPWLSKAGWWVLVLQTIFVAAGLYRALPVDGRPVPLL